MSSWHKACKGCVLSGNCLFQDNDDVESCGDVENYEEEKNVGSKKIQGQGRI